MFRAAALQNHDCGCFHYAACKEQGIGCEKDEKVAREYYGKAADAGLAEGKYAYGRCLINGIGGKVDEMEGAKLVKIAADEGYAVAQLLYGALLLRDGAGWSANMVESARYMKMGEDQAEDVGHRRSGVCLMCGIGVRPDREKRRDDLKDAAEVGKMAALTDFGIALMSGSQGVTKNESKGMECLRMAAEKGNIKANYYLGLELIRRNDVVGGCRYVEVAAKVGHRAAEKLMEKKCRKGQPEL
jgi:TPR repeat protein